MIDAGLREILDLAVRWVHVVAATLWIGNSMLWNWIDRNLEKPDDPHAIGKIWLLHSGAFYRMEKTLHVDGAIANRAHWFKWQAYTTWLSGALLLAIVYYAAGGALLLATDSPLNGTSAIAVGAGLIIIAWPLYDLLWRSPIARAGVVSGLLALALILALSYALIAVFSGRAAFVHVGAMLATIMAGNVRMIIMPAQRQMSAAVATGGAADQVLSDRAKTRSIHNNYLTYPVIALMLSSHFPGIYSQQYAWLLSGLIVVAGASVRHFMNIRFTNPRWGYGIAATVVTALVLLVLTTGERGRERERAADVSGQAVSFADARHVIDRRCGACHSAAPADPSFTVAPGGVTFDTPESIQIYAPRIMQRAVRDRTMPLGNKTKMTDAERDMLRRWIEAGAKY
jgi:uncharacterized membrane protein